jgi:hypothetical protein
MPRSPRHLPQGYSFHITLRCNSRQFLIAKGLRRVLNTLRYIHANPKAAGVRKGFYDPYSNYGHYGRLEADGISEWHPSFLQLASSLKGCSNRYERFCKRYRHTPRARLSGDS